MEERDDAAPQDLPAPDEGESAEAEDEREALSRETVLAWLDAVRPAPVLALLRDPDFAHVGAQVFWGFRVSAQGYANPMVRRRLVQEVLQNDFLADKLRQLAEEAPPKAIKETVPSIPAPPAEAKKKEKSIPDKQEELRGERDRRRRERDEARAALAEAEAARGAAESAQRRTEAARDEAERRSRQQAQRIARLERQVTRLQQEQQGLLRTLRQQQTATARARPQSQSPAETPRPGPDTEARPSPWPEAVAHLIDKGKPDLALTLAEDVLRADAGEQAALEIALRAWEKRGDRREAVAYARRLLSLRLARGERRAAGEALLQLMALTPRPGDEEKSVRTFLAALRADESGAVEQMRSGLARLRGLAPAAHEWLAALIAAAATPALAQALLPVPGALGPDDPLPLEGGEFGRRPPTARRALEAVNAGDVAMVTALRAALERLRQDDLEQSSRVEAALEQVAGDESALIPLLRAPRGAVVVDGSNAAWFEQSALAAGRPRLRPLLELRRLLRRRGYFPVILYGDAPLPYTIDDSEGLREMMAHREITLVDGGVDADEVLLREAKRLGAPLVTNDRMLDWDPQEEVEKIRYTLSMSGEAHLLA